MPNFAFAIAFVLDQEGGYVANDAGRGETNMGINSSANPGVDVKSLTEAQATVIYKAQYWDSIALDLLPIRLGVAVFDGAVNSGPRTAVTLLQRAVGVTEDGVLGPVTAAAVRNMPTALRRFMVLRALRYTQHPQFITYGPVWLARLLECHAFCLGLPE